MSHSGGPANRAQYLEPRNMTGRYNQFEERSYSIEVINNSWAETRRGQASVEAAEQSESRPPAAGENSA